MSVDIKAARAVIEAASPERPMLYGRTKTMTYDETIAEFAVALRRGPEVGAVVVHFPAEDNGDGAESVFVAMTGNGPKAEDNARYIASSFDPVCGWGACVDEIERLRALNDVWAETASTSLGEMDAAKALANIAHECLASAEGEVKRLRSLVTRACSMLDDAVQLRDDADKWFPAIAAIRREIA
jgi:hypothetical protein